MQTRISCLLQRGIIGMLSSQPEEIKQHMAPSFSQLKTASLKTRVHSSA